MSLGIAFKGPEGVVLAADSRVTLYQRFPWIPGETFVLPATFDHATKLLRLPHHKYVGIITYGAGSIGAKQPRTAHSFLPEFEKWLGDNELDSVQEYAEKVGEFFSARWHESDMPQEPALHDNMYFFIAGYDAKSKDERGKDIGRSIYGKLFEVAVPMRKEPIEQVPGEFGVLWGGQREIVDRLLHGYDARLLEVCREFLGIEPANWDTNGLMLRLKEKVAPAIPYQFLPLQDCIDLSEFLINASIMLQKWTTGLRGVGGAVDVATITRTDGFQYFKSKTRSIVDNVEETTASTQKVIKG